jgi:NitT/TauT family transport system ATP-binding protein
MEGLTSVDARPMTSHPAQPAAVGPVKVRLRGLRRRFLVHGRAIDALAGIDLDVHSGEFLCVVGPSGCGKTTLLRILAGLETSSAGEIEVRRSGRPGDRSSGPLNAMVFQEQSIFPWMTVRDNIALGLKARGIAKRERHAVADAYVKKVGLSGFGDALPYQLSGGMKQRVSIARAFANDPEIFLMDEPFAALDEQTKLILQAELLRVWEESKKTVLYVTHSIDEAIVLADRLVIMTARPGRIKDIVDVTAVFGRPRTVEAVKSSPRYGELFGRVWGQLRDEVLAASASESQPPARSQR